MSSKRNPIDSLRRRFNQAYRVDSSTGRWIWTKAIGNNGYGAIGYGGRKVMTAHRASWILHRGEISDGSMVLHRCDVRSCCNPAHLYLGDAKQNAKDLMERGSPYLRIRDHITSEIESKRIANLPRGDKHHRSAAKLSPSQVVEILSANESQREIASRYGVCQQLISKIKRGEYWRHVHADS